jgi:pimeloyl-ACP methyl ester carboxylesterase
MMTTVTQDDYALSDEPGWKDISWDGCERQIELSTGQLNYVELGTGPGTPLVLLHGIGGCWQHWLQNIPRFAQTRRVIAIDFPGFGSSPLPHKRVTVGRYARLVDELCERLGLGQVTLVGNSLGGLVALETAANYPQRVERMVLAAPAGISTRNVRHAIPTLLKLVSLQSPELQKLLARVHRAQPEHPLALAVAHPRSFERGLLRAAFSPSIGTRAGFLHVATNLAEQSARGQLLKDASTISCPVLIIWGRNDQILPVADIDVLAAMLNRSSQVILEDTGHMPPLERPREFNRLTLAFA